jgi:hypothetical protein
MGPIADVETDHLTALSLKCQTAIIELLGPHGVLCIDQTSMYFRTVTQDVYLSRVHRAIAKFGLDPAWTMRALYTTGGLIYGAITVFIILPE